MIRSICLHDFCSVFLDLRRDVFESFRNLRDSDSQGLGTISYPGSAGSGSLSEPHFRDCGHVEKLNRDHVIREASMN